MFAHLSTKNKTMLFVAIVLIFFSITLYSVIYYNQMQERALQEKQYYKKMTASYIKVLAKHKEFYQNRIRANVRSEGVKEAFAKQQRQKLYELSLGRWNTLSKENKYLRVMHFHLPNGRSFLRMHQSQKYGDEIAQQRPMVAEVHRTQKPLSGFEAGIFNLAYRVFLPVFYQNKYIGALEFGSRPDQILSEMKYFNELNGALFVQNEKLGLYKEDENLQVNGHTLQYHTMEDESILQALPKNYDFAKTKKLMLNGKMYVLYSFDLLDFQNKSAAKVVFFSDVTQDALKFDKMAHNLFLVMGILLGVLLLVIHFGFNRLIAILDQTNEKLILNQHFMESIFNNTAHAIIVTDMQGVITKFNKKAQEILGFDESEVVFKKNISEFHKHKRSLSFFEDTHAHLQQNMECTYVSKSAHEIPVKIFLTALYDHKDALIGFIFIAEDRTYALHSQKQLQNYMHLIDENILTATADIYGNFKAVSHAFAVTSGYSQEELIGHNCYFLRYNESDEHLYTNMLEAMQNNTTYKEEFHFLTKDGKGFWVDLVVYPDFDTKENKVGYTFIMQNITNKKRIEEISITDALTGIYNRRYFNETFSKMIEGAKRSNEFVSFMILDIDYFKQYNDTYGHQQGDRALKMVAQCIESLLKRASDYAYRLGGEEFGVIFKVHNAREAFLFAQHIKQSIEDLHISHEASTVSSYLTVSIGLVSLYAQDMHKDDEVFKEADDLLYEAKRGGRNRIETNSDIS